MKKWRKGGVALAVAVALSASLGVGTAFAAGTTTLDSENGASWTIPTSAMTNTVWKDADGNLVAEGTEGATQYKVLTTWAEAWSTSGPDYLGVSNSAYFGNGGNGNPTVTTLEAAEKNTTVGVWATSANESPNAYNWNRFYNLYADANALETTDWDSIQSNSTGTGASSSWSTEAGVWCGFKYRPEVVWLSNSLNSTAAETYIGYIRNGQYSATSTDNVPDADEDGSYDSSYSTYYIEGDENYSPTIIQPNNNSPYSFVASAYELAGAAETVIEATADYEGLSDDEELNWKTVNQLPRSNRYSESPTECALNIEKLAKGSVYYTLAKINDGTVEKKKVAYVCYPWSYSTTDGRTGTTTTYTTEDQVVVAVYDYTENIGNGPMDGRASWTPLVVDQLSTDTVYSEKTGGGAVSSEDSSTTTYTLYIATADDLAECDVIYCSPNVSASAAQIQGWIMQNATSDEAAAKAADISYLTDWPCITNGSNFTMEKLIYGTYGMDFIYPELFPSMQLSSYWCDVIYHLTDDSLASAMSWIYSTATMPSGTTLSNIPAQYSEETVKAKFAVGLEYYKATTTATTTPDDEGNETTTYTSSDETINRILNNIALDGTTELNGSAYAFNGFAPTDTWLADTADISEKTALEALIATANGLTETDYTAETWATLQEAVADAQEVCDNDEATQTEINDAAAALQAAIDALEDAPAATDFAALNEAIAAANALTASDYTDRSWATVEEALAVANAVLAEEDATQTAVDDAAADLVAAIDGLITVNTNTSFSDVKPGDASNWFADAVTYLAAQNIMMGYSDDDGNPTGEFGSFNDLMREEFIVILWRYAEPEAYAAYDEDAAVDTTGFDDAVDGEYYTEALNWAKEVGVTTGYSGTNSFGVGDSIQFQEMVTMIQRYVDPDASATSAELEDLRSFADYSDVQDYATVAMAWAYANGVYSGYSDGSNTVRPVESVYRGRAAQVIYNCIQTDVL